MNNLGSLTKMFNELSCFSHSRFHESIIMEYLQKYMNSGLSIKLKVRIGVKILDMESATKLRVSVKITCIHFSLIHLKKV